MRLATSSALLEPVADASDGGDPRRPGRIVLDLRPELLDFDVDEPRIAEELVVPHAGEEHLAEDLARAAPAPRAVGTP